MRRPSPIAVMSPNVEWVGGSAEDQRLWYAGAKDMTPGELWESQPHLRTVVTFLARNVAQLGLHTFERVDETDRRRDRTGPVARALSSPDGRMTTYELIYALVGDFCLYDRAYWYVGPSTATDSAKIIRRLPPTWVTPVMENPFEVKSYRVSVGRGVVDVDPSRILAFTGYSPTSASRGSPTVEALKDTLREQVESSTYRRQVWRRGGRVSAVIERPADAPRWSDAAREAFREDWYAKYTGSGPRSGGTPLLEDGMKLTKIDFNAREQQYVEAARLSLVTVAAAFHVNPTMIGQNEGANYSNVREFRRALYVDTLGPMFAQIEGRINTFLLPMLGVDPGRFYVEFNIAEKLQGSFEEQAAVMSTLVGRPIMSANEGRARFNLPKVDEGDGLVVPLNVLVGGQASPRDSGEQNRNAAAPQIKAPATDPQREKVARVLAGFFKRQRRVVLGALGNKAPEWWDGKRWNRELSVDLLAASLLVSTDAARRAIEAVGGDPDDFDESRTVAYLRAKAKGVAEAINATTLAQLVAAVEDDDGDPAHVFDVAEGARADEGGLSLSTSLAAFGTVEAGRQTGAGTKTWVVTSGNPRSSHAAMDGETVPISQAFSNGMDFPGSGGDADEVAGCRCEVSISY